jgi:hypothetical protein
VIDLTRIGEVQGPATVQWTQRDAMLYAVALGLGADDPTKDLEFTTENSVGYEQQVIGTYCAVIAQNAALPRNLGDVNATSVLHAGQEIRIARELPPAGVLAVSQSTTAVYDKGTGALAVIESTGVDPTDGKLVFASRNLSFIRGGGGFGGRRGPSPIWAPPARSADFSFPVPTSWNQSLIYRLCGDRNPLHSDPGFAARAGFDRPILHGLATFGMVAKRVADAVGVPPSLAERQLSVRFAHPVTPGQVLTVRGWLHEDTILFEAALASGKLVLSQGKLATAEARWSGDHQLLTQSSAL